MVPYTGTVHFTSNDYDPGVVLPSDYTFTINDNGRHQFHVTLETVTRPNQPTIIRAFDSVNNAISGSLSVSVDSPEYHLAFLQQPTNSTVGQLRLLSVDVLDSSNNLVISDNSVISLSRTANCTNSPP